MHHRQIGQPARIQFRVDQPAPDIDPEQVDDATRAIERAFRLSVSTSTHFPCHRVALSLSAKGDAAPTQHQTSV
jgi:hypothetical protein